MLDLKKYFRVGDRIQIGYIDFSGRRHEYVSQVVELYENGFMDVLIPIHNKRIVYIRPDTVLAVSIPKGEAVYEIKATIHEKLFGRIPLLKLQVFPEVNKIQRRNFYRLKLMRDIEVRLVEDFKERIYGERFKGNLHDISAGGVLLSFKKELQENDNLELTLDLNGKKLIVFGVVVRRTLSANSTTEYIYGIKYYRISEYERNEIMKFIFEEQRKLIKKGLI
jgi:c-di-GMP-binding flagellar brake protein YcgR